MSRTTWGAIGKGDVVILSGRALTVTKAKPKGKKVAVTVRDKHGEFSSVVKAKDVVKLQKPDKPRGPLHDRNGEQQRWATDKEAAAVDRGEGLPEGNPKVRKPPAKAEGGPWDEPKGKTERMLEDILGAKLVGEATDEDAGYYVPPVDVATVAAHLLLFHGVAGKDYPSMAAALTLHAEQHDEARQKHGTPLKVNHWHTKERP